MSKKREESRLHLFEGWTFTKKNYLLFAAGILIIITGYIIMAKGEVDSFRALTLAPVLLFLGYIIVIPLALIYRDKSVFSHKEQETTET